MTRMTDAELIIQYTQSKPTKSSNDSLKRHSSQVSWPGMSVTFFFLYNTEHQKARMIMTVTDDGRMCSTFSG